MKKVRIGLIALAVMLSVGGAFATKSHVKSGDTEWGVTSTSGSNYNVVAITGTVSCDGEENVCTVLSSSEPVDGQIPISETNSPETGNFSQH